MKTLRQIAAESVFTENQLKKLEALVLEDNFYPESCVREEIDLFLTGLGLSPSYFMATPLETIARHIEALRAAEIMAALRGEKVLRIEFTTEHEAEALYLVEDSHYKAIEIEERIEDKYPHDRLQSYRTLRKARGLEYLRLYIVDRPEFPAGRVSREETDLRKIADKTFLATISKETFKRTQELLEQARGWESPLIDVTPVPADKEVRISVVTNTDASPRFFTNVSDVINSHGLHSNRKYIEHFGNGKTIYTHYLDAIEDRAKLQDLIEDISNIYVIPTSPLSSLFREGRLSAQEMVFGTALWSFAHQFLSGYNEEYLKLADALKDSPELQGILRDLKTRLAKETYTEPRVWDVLSDNPEGIKSLFRLFDRKFNPAEKVHDIAAGLAAFRKDVVRKVVVEADRNVFLAGALFVETVLKTNFYIREKTSIAFMYKPDFLNRVDYPLEPFGLFHIVGREFRGFHIRFRDIARGGIRIVRSSHYQNYLNNSDFIFDENYGLASTQQRKNKDLPDGGSKGTILLRWGFQDQPVAAFKKYIDGLLDLMLPNPAVLDYYGKDVILFLGPDEGTAELMEWAALRARTRGYRFWKAFTTGKPESMGGIPHDLYGMTTRSVREYVVGSLRKLGLKEEKITEVMTGGPDGDLGSNEILLSKDRILAIVDGSGVLYDPQVLNRRELARLAKARMMVEHFNRKLLSEEGFFVHVKDADVRLPDGERVESGLEFRNTFHLHPKFKADIFVPCGGRPSSVNINNWTAWLDEKGQPRFKVIVEGANLFITQQARLRLEEKGVILYKDASANKGGVTSSSLEVLSALAMTDKEFEELMVVRNGTVSDFRKAYIEEIIAEVADNARREFEVIWRENTRTGIPRSILSDRVSEKINAIKDSIRASSLFEDKALVRRVIEVGCPPVLCKLLGIGRILQRVPESYLRALFASRLAGRYVYEHGLEANEIDFFNFLQQFMTCSALK
ncbi:MAG TPA: NAD-glutamate dehydrogenase domain-containing protein [Terriglobales bacterium]|nr:NAD-glutamate dehydrogenase domain-containing protein [Terriglobales bacterium]